MVMLAAAMRRLAGSCHGYRPHPWPGLGRHSRVARPSQLAALGDAGLDSGLLATVAACRGAHVLHLSLAPHLRLGVAQSVLLARVLLLLGAVRSQAAVLLDVAADGAHGVVHLRILCGRLCLRERVLALPCCQLGARLLDSFRVGGVHALARPLCLAARCCLVFHCLGRRHLPRALAVHLGAPIRERLPSRQLRITCGHALLLVGAKHVSAKALRGAATAAVLRPNKVRHVIGKVIQHAVAREACAPQRSLALALILGESHAHKGLLLCLVARLAPLPRPQRLAPLKPG
mmetsp:Transcript_12431/g.31810  ORF Transcript_12431/g.31810 Transcript_12431/m.31810 type:complete len:289 (-) Transcript_12431:298-1164(-)